ncbi:AAA family ATPase [Bacterioplanoides sp.]|uniref:AAA family ATPase n=1 Tax=Bacterioplanoides sp. TaxID=2066072 RepID=UPI003B00C7A1
MKIKHLKLSHYRRFTDFKITLDKQLTVLVARNGAGKSSILDAAATMLGSFVTRLPKVMGISFKDTDLQVDYNGKKQPYTRITATSYPLDNGDSNEACICWDRTEKRDSTQKTAKQIPEAIGIKKLNDYADTFVDADNDDLAYELPVFIHYGTGRGVFDLPQRTKGFAKDFRRFDAFAGSLESRANFKRFVEYFYDLEKRESELQKQQRSFEVELPELKAIRCAVEKMMPDFSNPESVRPAGIQVDWKRDGEIQKLRIEQLSDGYRTTLAMVMDVAARMAEANPDMTDPLQTSGMILIDEIDLHLHPGWQQTILTDLTSTFPNIQFVVSTHSPQVVSSVEPSSIRVIDWIDNEAILHPVSFSLGAETQQVLQDVLGLESLRAPQLEIVDTLKHYIEFVENNRWDCEDAKKLRAKLDAWSNGHEPELMRLDMDIQLRALDREEG